MAAEKRYQVFVSSTYEDLQQERLEVITALLELDCIPAGMELFPAASEDQWTVIKRVIDACDYYVLIVGGRYGSIGPKGRSYTEMEYRYALVQEKPTIAFLHRDPDSLPARQTEMNADGREKLKAFRELIQQKLCKHWSTSEELGSVVSRSMFQLLKTTPAVGWVRADSTSEEISQEMLRLRRQVDSLEENLRVARISPPEGTDELAAGNETFVIPIRFSASLHMPKDPILKIDFDQDTKDLSESKEFTWSDIVKRIGPLMIDEAPEDRLRAVLGNMVLEPVKAQHRDEFRGRYLHNCSVVDSCFQTIKIQLKALGIMTRSERKRNINDTRTHWKLTPYGDQLVTQLLAVKRGSAANN